MIETNSLEINVEDLIRSIRQEVLIRKNQLNQLPIVSAIASPLPDRELYDRCPVTVLELLTTHLGHYNDEAITSGLRMEPLVITDADKISLCCIHKLHTMVLGQQCQIKVRLFNGCNRILSSTAPHPYHLSYHWEDAINGESVVYEGLRTPLNPPTLMSADTEYALIIKAPDFAGSYVLKIVAVQEGVRWHQSTKQATFTVNVVQSDNSSPVTSYD